MSPSEELASQLGRMIGKARRSLNAAVAQHKAYLLS
jgi:hypothetical protein